MDGWLDVLLDVAAFAVAALATFTDLRARRIPAWLTLPATAAAPLMLFALDRPAEALWCLAGAAACAAVPALLAWGRAAGGGDIALAAALGSLLGLLPALEAELIAFAAILTAGAVTAVRARDLRAALRTELPFAPALLLGTAATLGTLWLA
jgi:prepilin signal peptidase PulO-like enzyme (type II secretory pathway)